MFAPPWGGQGNLEPSESEVATVAVHSPPIAEQ